MRLLVSLCFAVSVLMGLHIPLISIYASRLGAPPSIVGLICGLGPVLYAVIALLSGLVAGRLGERGIIALSLGILALSYASLPLVGDVATLAVVASLPATAYAAFWPSVESLFSRRGGSVAAFSTSWSAGTIAGSLLATPAILALERALWTMAALSALSIPLALSLGGRGGSSGEAVSLRDLVRSARDLPHSWAWAFSYAATLGAVFAFYPLLVEDWGLPVWYVSLALFSLVGARTLVFSLCSRVPGPLSLAGSLLLASAALIPLARDPATLSIASAIAGAGTGLLYAESLSSAFSSDPQRRSVYTGLFESFIGLGYAAGPAIAGAASSLSLGLAIPAAAALSSLISCLFSLSGTRRSGS